MARYPSGGQSRPCLGLNRLRAATHEGILQHSCNSIGPPYPPESPTRETVYAGCFGMYAVSPLLVVVLKAGRNNAQSEYHATHIRL